MYYFLIQPFTNILAINNKCPAGQHYMMICFSSRNNATINNEGCLAINRQGGYRFNISDCNDAKSPICFKDKDYVTEKNNTNECGPNTLMDVRGRCFCQSGFFESTSGSANTKVGCVNPCSSNPCQSLKNSLCYANSNEKYLCICQDNYSPDRNGSCSKNCQIDGKEVLHGDTIDIRECIDGEIYHYCMVDGARVSHQESFKMADNVVRICENGVMKLPKCEFYLQK